ncbi:MAG: 30S ribosomal protein S20 [Cyanobacteria bacterium P01_H01_bin.58]
MANIKSAIKRIQVAERNRLRNKSYKSAIKTLTKRYLAALASYSSEPSPENLELARGEMSAVFSRIDKAVKRGVYHKNAGARRKSSLSRAWKQIEAQQQSPAS